MAQAAVKTPDLKVMSEPIEVDPKRVQINDAGQAWRTVLVRMPEGATQDDLRNPKIWRKVQGMRHAALIKFDHLFVLAHDESWAARATVTHATAAEAHLAIERVGTFREQGQSLFGDGTLEVYWDGSAYAVRRASDAIRVINEGFTTEALAIAALRNWYPTKKAG